jgi:hypothetical protein
MSKPSSKRIKGSIKFDQYYKDIVEELLDMLKRQDDSNFKLKHYNTTISDLESLLTINTNIANPWIKCWYTDSRINVKGIFRLSTYITLVAQGAEWPFEAASSKIILYAGMLQYKVLSLGSDSDSEEPLNSDGYDESDDEDMYVLEIPDNLDEELEYVMKFKLKNGIPMKDWTDDVIRKLLQYAIDFPMQVYLKSDISDVDTWLTNYN